MRDLVVPKGVFWGDLVVSKEVSGVPGWVLR